MKIIHFLEGRAKSQSTNGIVKAVYYLSKYEKKNIDVEIWCISSKVKEYAEEILESGVKCRILPSKVTEFFKIANSLINKESDLLFHFHGTYNFYNYLLSSLIISKKIPYIVSPHGALHNKAFNQKKIKKMFFTPLLFSFLYNAKKIRMISVMESNTVPLPYNFLKKRFFIAINGVELAYNSVNCNKDIFDKKSIGFLGRLDPYHKGLDLLLKAVESIPNIELKIVGPVEDKEFKENALKNMKLKDKVYFGDKILGNEVITYVNSLYFFVHPSRYEVGLPLSVMEALSYGLPVITTVAIDDKRLLEKYQAGFDVETNSDSIKTVLEKVLNLDYNKWCLMKKNARKLVKEMYSWETASKETVKNYKEILIEKK